VIRKVIGRLDHRHAHIVACRLHSVDSKLERLGLPSSTAAAGAPRDTFIVEIARTTATITLAVYDCGWGPTPRFATRRRTNAEHGRGLAIVTAIADQTGHEGSDAIGHKVWARIHTRTTIQNEDYG
jgi:hypothetical protein